ncbi:MAG TPA: hypothetical protein VIF62_36385 [Labilithrix sp.]
MRNALLLFSLLLGACATTEAPVTVADAPAPASETPPPVDSSDSDDDHGIEGPIPDEVTPARFELLGSRVDAGKLRMTGKVYDTHVPAVFRLRNGYGCAREITLQTTTTGIAFSVALGADDLAVALGCAVDVEAGDELSTTVTLTPDAHATSATGGLTLSDDIALVSAELDPSAGDNVRIVVLAPSPLASATAKLGGSSYHARFVDDDASSAIFELPAREWAKAVVTATHILVDARDTNGSSASMIIAPYAVASEMRGDE